VAFCSLPNSSPSKFCSSVPWDSETKIIEMQEAKSGQSGVIELVSAHWVTSSSHSFLASRRRGTPFQKCKSLVCDKVWPLIPREPETKIYCAGEDLQHLTDLPTMTRQVLWILWAIRVKYGPEFLGTLKQEWPWYSLKSISVSNFEYVQHCHSWIQFRNLFHLQVKAIENYNYFL
jgi:hypothetical protein